MTQPAIRPPHPFKLFENDKMAGCEAMGALLAMDETPGEEHPARTKPLPLKPSNDKVVRNETIHFGVRPVWPRVRKRTLA